MHSASITLESEIIKPSRFIRLLGAFLNQGLTYKAHFSILEERVPKLLSALKSITLSTWGTLLINTRKLYIGLDMGRVGLGFGLCQPTHMGFGSTKVRAQPNPCFLGLGAGWVGSTQIFAD